MRTDIVRVYKDVHTWVGIISGLALFIAFYAGAITMFETPLERWATPPAMLAPPPPLAAAQQLIDATLAAHPEAARNYQIVVATGPEQPARMTWRVRQPGEGRGDGTSYAAGFSADGSLQVVQQQPAKVAQLIDVLHQQIGLPFAHGISMPIMGAIALMYALALVSGVIILLPTFVQDLFALRLGKNLKRMWLDVHNVLGVLSLPFHLIMALTSVVFAFHDQIYDAQNKVSYAGTLNQMFAIGEPAHAAPPAGTRPLTPAELVARIQSQAPGFAVAAMTFSNREGALEVRVSGSDPRYGHRAPTSGFAGVDPYSGEIVSRNFLPGHQDNWSATLTGFFTLHFGSFGGNPIRWGYFLLGLAGAFLFYSGNLLWIESRRRLERRGAVVIQKRSTHMMANLTIGVTAGCMAGISLTIAAAKWLPGRVADVGTWHTGIYYVTFLGAIAWAFARGSARAASELLLAAALATAAIPLTSALCAAGLLDSGWNHGDSGMLIDLVAAAGAIAFLALASVSRTRALRGRRDSVWSSRKPANEAGSAPTQQRP